MRTHRPIIEVSSKMVWLQPGMYTVRLALEALGNIVTLNTTHTSIGTVDFFPGDGVVRNTLVNRGDCVIVRVKTDVGCLLLTEFREAGQQKKLKIKIDRLAADGVEDQGCDYVFPSTDHIVTPVVPVAKPSLAKTLLDPSTLKVCQFGYIVGRGDSIVENDWLGNPLGDERVTGFAVSVVGLPVGVSLKYRVLIEGTKQYASAVGGQFVGTRQKAKALLGVVFELVGQGEGELRLSGEVVFSGEPPLAIKPGHQMSGTLGTEHLVALRLTINSLVTQSAATVSSNDTVVAYIDRQSSLGNSQGINRASPDQEHCALDVAVKKSEKLAQTISSARL